MHSLGYIRQYNALYAFPGSEDREDVFYYSDIDEYYYTADLQEHWKTADLADSSHIIFSSNDGDGESFSIEWIQKELTITLPDFYSLETAESIAHEIKQLAITISDDIENILDDSIGKKHIAHFSALSRIALFADLYGAKIS